MNKRINNYIQIVITRLFKEVLIQLFFCHIIIRCNESLLLQQKIFFTQNLHVFERFLALMIYTFTVANLAGAPCPRLDDSLWRILHSLCRIGIISSTFDFFKMPCNLQNIHKNKILFLFPKMIFFIVLLTKQTILI